MVSLASFMGPEAERHAHDRADMFGGSGLSVSIYRKGKCIEQLIAGLLGRPWM